VIQRQTSFGKIYQTFHQKMDTSNEKYHNPSLQIRFHCFCALKSCGFGNGWAAVGDPKLGVILGECGRES